MLSGHFHLDVRGDFSSVSSTTRGAAPRLQIAAPIPSREQLEALPPAQLNELAKAHLADIGMSYEEKGEIIAALCAKARGPSWADTARAGAAASAAVPAPDAAAEIPALAVLEKAPQKDLDVLAAKFKLMGVRGRNQLIAQLDKLRAHKRVRSATPPSAKPPASAKKERPASGNVSGAPPPAARGAPSTPAAN